jgi:hypothetical protein
MGTRSPFSDGEFIYYGIGYAEISLPAEMDMEKI